MKKLLLATSALGLAASAATAGGIERVIPSYGALFEDGNYMEFNFRTVKPSVSGQHPAALATAAGGVSTDTEGMAKPEDQFGFALKMDLTEQLSFGFFMNEQYGARAEYTQGVYGELPAVGAGPCPAALGGGLCVASGGTPLKANWNSIGYEAVLKYDFNDRASVYGGMRALTSSAEIAIPAQLAARASAGALGDYYADGSTETDFGYILGAAYEIPDIAARVAVTYRSEIVHDFDVDEMSSITLAPLALPGVTATPTILDEETSVKVRMPQSLTIDFQTGIAENTLLFGSAKWTEWSVWEVRTEEYEAATGNEITGFENDIWTYSLGIGRRINDNYSVFGAVGYEEAKGGEASRLAPTDGYTSLTVGGSYTFENNMVVRAGLSHVWLGDAEVGDGTKFEDNTATGFGFSVGFNF